jgi:short-subunit dehydrogenase
MSPPDLSGSTALVTGASSGIGAAMARQLAAWRCDLVLTARRADRLAALAGELRASRRISCTVVTEDLAQPGGAARLHDRVREAGPIDILINNAGFAIYRQFGDTAWPRHAELLQLNVLSLVELTYLFLPDLASRGRRTHILNVSSPVGPWIDVPGMATYGASKAAVLGFSRALAAELRRSNVRVTCLCPGGTTTEFSEVAGQTLGGLARAGMMGARRCAAIGLRGMLRGRRVVVPGITNKLIRLLSCIAPRPWMGAISTWLMGPPQAPMRDPAPQAERDGAPPRRGHGS